MSTSSTCTTSNKGSKEGCILLEHHLDAVFSDFPISSVSHIPVNTGSTMTTCILFYCNYIT